MFTPKSSGDPNFWFAKWGPRYIEAGERLQLHCVTEWTFTSNTVVDLFEDDLFDADDFVGRLLIDPTLANGQLRTHRFQTGIPTTSSSTW